MGFYIDWLIEGIAGIACYTILTISSSIYIGMFLYITGMVKDMKVQIDQDLSPELSKETNKWMIYLQEIKFHAEIIRCALLYIDD